MGTVYVSEKEGAQRPEVDYVPPGRRVAWNVATGQQVIVRAITLREGLRAGTLTETDPGGPGGSAVERKGKRKAKVSSPPQPSERSDDLSPESPLLRDVDLEPGKEHGISR